jgi:hypothetical protein
VPLLVRLPMDVHGGRLEAIVPRKCLLAGYRFQFEVEAEWQKFTEPIRWVVIPAQRSTEAGFGPKCSLSRRLCRTGWRTGVRALLWQPLRLGR